MYTTKQTFVLSNEPKALEWINENMSACQMNLTLPSLIWKKYSQTNWKIWAFYPNWIDLTKLDSFKDTITRPLNSLQYPQENSPFYLVKNILYEYVHCSKNNNLICLDVDANSKTYIDWPWENYSPVAFLNKEVYNIITNVNLTDDNLDFSLRRSMGGRYGAAFCSQVNSAVSDHELSLAYIEKAVVGLSFIVMPAFDGDGFLVLIP